MHNRQRKTTQAERAEQHRAVRPEVWATEARKEGDSRAGGGERGDEARVARPEGGIAGEGVVDKRDGGGPHEDEHALEVELHVEQVRGLAVGHERVEGGRQGEAHRHAEEVRAADDDVRGRGGVVPGWYLREDEPREADEYQGPDDVGPDVNRLVCPRRAVSRLSGWFGAGVCSCVP